MMHKERKGIVLAGGSGSRLYPATSAISKQLIPLYDKPMVYYPISVLMLAEIREILIISTPQHIDLYKTLLGDGSDWGIELSYQIQPEPGGLAQAFIIGKDFIGDNPSALVLGDNIFYGAGLEDLLISADKKSDLASVFAYRVADPERFGVVEFGEGNKAMSLEEKPQDPKSNFAVTGLYFYDENACEYVSELRPSERGELEITDLNKVYLNENKLNVETLSRGFAWLDTGTPESLIEAAHFIYTLEKRQGTKISCLEEIALSKGWITYDEIYSKFSKMKGPYVDYVIGLNEK